MPFYEYRCADCGTVTTLLQKRNAERTGHPCSSCGGTRTERVFSVFAAATGQGQTNSGGGHTCSGPACCRGGACSLDN